MSSESAATVPARLDPAFAGEILGATAIVRHPGLGPEPIEGTLVDESMNLLILRVRPNGRLLRVPKSGASGTLIVGERALPLNGELLRMRPEDRTKRLAPRGRRR
ncbi:MAG TPA: ribonuclease P protein subunit [Thermoplasmata archaeon]|nr:ribonuclease P protein subunit [Thermoplasmata archaeon]